MSDPTSLSATAQVDVLTIGAAPAASLALTHAALASSIGTVMHNAAATQHGMQQVANATTAVTCAQVLAGLAPGLGGGG